MINNTSRKIPKKYQAVIKEVYKDDDGYWCQLNKGYVWLDDATVCNGESFEQLLEALKEVEKVKG